MKKALLSALLLGAAVLAATPSEAGPWRGHPRAVFHPHARFAFRHDFRHFTPIEHRWWRGGHWRHMRWHGRWGWWWGVGGAWYWYPAPVYPYPGEVSGTYYDDDEGDYDDGYGDDSGGGGYGMWHHCSNPEGYYPYIKDCKSGWEEVPATPNGGDADMQGGPDNGPPDQDDEDDRSSPPPPQH